MAEPGGRLPGGCGGKNGISTEAGKIAIVYPGLLFQN
jgi:hypothetical protein